MRIALDLRNLHQAMLHSPNGGLGGPGVYSRDLARHLVQDPRAGDVEWVLVVFPGAPARQIEELIEQPASRRRARTRLRAVGVPRVTRRLMHSRYARLAALADAATLSLVCQRDRLGVFHGTDGGTGPWYAGSTAFVSTTHDLHNLRRPAGGRPRKADALLVGWPARRADAVVASSEETARDVRTMLGVPGERIRVVYPGVSPALVGSDAQCPRFPSTGPLLEPFFLHVGVLRRHKNPDNILAALARVTRETLTTHRLVCVGPYQVAPGLREALTATWRAAGGPEDRLIFLEGVGDAELGALYRQSSGLVFPSLHEGFGIPIAEALAVGTPVVASCFGASREAGGDLAIYVDPGDPTAIAEGCLRMARDDTHRERIRREGPAWVASRFTWSRASREVFDLYVQLSNGDCSSV